MIRISRREGRGGLGWAVVMALVVVAALAGCANKQQATATPPAGEPAATATTTGNGTPFNFHWDSQSNCLSYTPHADSVMVGMGINFNSSANDTVTITVTAPAGCFSAAETTFTVSRGNSPTMTAYSVGSYALRISPTPCGKVTAGVGPSVIINSGK